MRTYAPHVTVIFVLAVSTACAPAPAEAPPPVVAPLVRPASEPHHELHLPPVGPSVHVTLDGKSSDVVLADVPHEAGSAQLIGLWRAAFPWEDPTPLHFDLV